jgi:hypothetical protein
MPPSTPIRKFTIKLDASAYGEYSSPEQYPKWIKNTIATLCSQVMEELLDPMYAPMTPEEERNFRAKQSFAFDVLNKKVLTSTGRAIVESHREYLNAQGVLADLPIEAMDSTQALLMNRKLKAEITVGCFDPRSSKLSAMDYIVELDLKMRTYNEQQSHPDMVIPDIQKKAYLQDALSNVPFLQAVTNREMEKAAQEGKHTFFTYDQYLTAIKGVATTYDQHREGRRSASIHHTQMGDPDEEFEPGPSIDDEIKAYAAKFMKRRLRGAAMSKTTWDTLSAEGKKTWDLMSDTDKKSILQHAMKRAENEQVTANNVEIAPDEEDEGGTAEEEGSLETAMELEINNATTDAKKQAHPGDLRRMMSNKGKGAKKKGSASKEGTVTMAVFSSPTDATIEASALETEHIDDVIKDYWSRDDDPDAADADF